MHGDDVGAGLGEVGQEAVGRLDHQMHIQRQLRRLAQGCHDGRADGNVRHEMTVHHIHVDIVGPGGLGGAHRRA